MAHEEVGWHMRSPPTMPPPQNLERAHDHEILVCKNITESFTSLVLCFLNVLFIIKQH